MNQLILEDIVRRALIEDIQNGDITSEAIFPENFAVTGAFIAEEPGVIAGFAVVAEIFRQLDPAVKCACLIPDGNMVSPGAKIIQITGPVKPVLAGERVALNFIRRLSGIASQTARMVLLITGTRAKITDTRKTTPGLRMLEKYAVRQGGGLNHRFNLADAVLIKDNHIAACGSITEAVKRARKYVSHTMTIEVEAENEAQVLEAVKAGADIILLDNMPPPEMARMVQLIRSHDSGNRNRKVIIEASGNIDESNVHDVAVTGVDIISSGAITHSVKAMDITLRIETISDDGQ
jgi:nicotinate-nucleotide pyrophosphorylase (carboxylating)